MDVKSSLKNALKQAIIKIDADPFGQVDLM
jgi:hypothetical protein